METTGFNDASFHHIPFHKYPLIPMAQFLWVAGVSGTTPSPASVHCDATRPSQAPAPEHGGATLNQLQRPNINDSAVFCIFGMKMRRRMLVKKHADDDPEKTTDDRHISLSRIA